MSKEESVIKNPKWISISDVFTHGVFSLVQEGAHLRLVYTFSKESLLDKVLDYGLSMPTGILCTSYSEAAYHVNRLAQMGVFPQVIINQGGLYNAQYQKIEDLDWGAILKDMLRDTDEEQEQLTLH